MIYKLLKFLLNNNLDFKVIGNVNINETINIKGYREIFLAPQSINYTSPILPNIEKACNSPMFYLDSNNYFKIKYIGDGTIQLLANSTWANNCVVYGR